MLMVAVMQCNLKGLWISNLGVQSLLKHYCSGAIVRICCNVYRIANKGEWSVTFWLLKDKEGFLSKEAIRGMYDGSIFEKIAKENELKKHK